MLDIGNEPGQARLLVTLSARQSGKTTAIQELVERWESEHPGLHILVIDMDTNEVLAGQPHLPTLAWAEEEAKRFLQPDPFSFDDFSSRPLALAYDDPETPRNRRERRQGRYSNPHKDWHDPRSRLRQ